MKSLPPTLETMLPGPILGYMEAAHHRFAKVRTVDHDDHARTVLLRGVTVNERGWVTGTEIAADADGCGWHDVTRSGAEQMHMIDAVAVRWVKAMVEDQHTGAIVEATR